jgi:pimeloyl-ACP methyl ester carboxylesterase
MLYLAGGPGGARLAAGIHVGSGRHQTATAISSSSTNAVRCTREPALTCHEIDEFVAAATGMSIMAASTAEKDLAAVRACHARLVGDGNDLASFDTSENASDIADLRTALGIREWNVYGVSYGNDLALQLLRDHPDGIRSLTVDSVVAPQINLSERFWPSAAEGLTAFFDACAAEPTCARASPGRGAGARIRQSSRSGGLRPDLWRVLSGVRGVHRHGFDSRRGTARPSATALRGALTATAGAPPGGRVRCVERRAR